MENLNLKALEMSLENEKFIKDAQVYKDLKGNIVVSAEQRRPVARIVRPDAPDAYIDEEGEIMPLSEKFTSRVMLITGDYTDHLVEAGMDNENADYMDFVNLVSADPFWKAQISQIDIDDSGEIFIYPQVTKQVVEFGLPDKMETKFDKLEIFYKKILPFKGWNSYKRVNLKYLNQIVCE
jgi:cell division protein FtsQ